jgi:hypothetical protein
MKLISFLVIICLFGMIVSAGCDAIPFTQPSKVVISKDPAACKSINIDCSDYEKDGGGSWTSYRDNTGCGCIRFAK